MRPYRTFTKNGLGSAGYEVTSSGKVIAYLTTCGGGLFNSAFSIKFIKGSPGKDRPAARDNLDKRIVQIARSVLSKSTDAQLAAYLKRIGFLASETHLHATIGLHIVGGNGFNRARFFARRVLQAQEKYQAAKAA